MAIHLFMQQGLPTYTTLDLGNQSNLWTRVQSNKKGLGATTVKRSVFVCSETLSSIHFHGIEMQMAFL